MFRRFIIHFAAYLIAGVFISVGLSKLLGHQDFVRILYGPPIINNFANLIAYLIPVLELILGMALIIPAIRRYGFLASIVLMAAFTAYNIYLLVFAPHVPCGCGGIFKDMSWTNHLYVNIGLLALAITGSLLTWKKTQGHNPVPLWSGVLFTFKKRRSANHQ